MFGHDDETKDNSTTQNDAAAQDDLAAQTNTDFANNDVNAQLDTAGSAPSVNEPLTDIAEHQEDTPLLSQTGTADATSSLDDQPDSETDDNVSADATSTPSPVDEDLIELKKQSLEELAPLVDHLDQTAEEKFRTTMMMIQATDNSGLIKDAHTAALKITDDKVRAQALLDIVNEINYFTQVGSAKTDAQ